MKKIFLIYFMLVSCISQAAANKELAIDTLWYSKWPSPIDDERNGAGYIEGSGGYFSLEDRSNYEVMGWNFYQQGTTDCSAYDAIIIEFNEDFFTGDFRVLIFYGDKKYYTNMYSDAYVVEFKEKTKIKVPLSDAFKSNVMGIYLQRLDGGWSRCGKGPCYKFLHLKSVSLVNASSISKLNLCDFNEEATGAFVPTAQITYNESHEFTDIIELEPTIGTIEKNPYNDEGEKVLKMEGNDWDQVAKFLVTLPKGLTWKDVERIQFDVAVPEGIDEASYKKIQIAVGTENRYEVYNKEEWPFVAYSGDWYPNYFYVEDLGFSPDIADWRTFDLYVGLSTYGDDIPGGYYLLNNVTLVFKLFDGLTINKIQSDETMAIYPNPSQDGIFYFTAGNEKPEWAVSEMSGRKLLSGNSLKVDLSRYQKGLYLIKIKEGENSIALKLISK